MHAILLATLHELGVARGVRGDDNHWGSAASVSSGTRGSAE